MGVLDDVNKLKSYFLSKDGGIMAGEVTPDITDSYDLGRSDKRWDTIYCKEIVAEIGGGEGGGGDADTVDGYDAAGNPLPSNLLALDPQSTFPSSVYPLALLKDGSRALEGSLTVVADATIDGVDIGIHTHTGVGSHGPTIAHANLTGKDADDHPQYTQRAQDEIVTGDWMFTHLQDRSAGWQFLPDDKIFKAIPHNMILAADINKASISLGVYSSSEYAMLIYDDDTPTTYMKVGRGDNSITLHGTDSTYKLWAGAAAAGSAPFHVKNDGSIFATAGDIAGWEIDSSTISKNDMVLNSVGRIIAGDSGEGVGAIIQIDAADPTWRLWIGHNTAASAPFRVNKVGQMYMYDAFVTGTLKSTNFISGQSGFSLDSSGLAEFQQIIARGRLEATVFAEAAISVASGKMLISDGAVIAVDIADTDDFIIVDTDVFQQNDIIRLKPDAYRDEWMRITAPYSIVDEGFKYFVARGLNDTEPTWAGPYDFYAGESVVRLGSAQQTNVGYPLSAGEEGGEFGEFQTGGSGATTGGGYLILEGSRNFGPFFGVSARYGPVYDQIVDVVRIGNLNGVHTYTSEEWGVFFGDANQYFSYDQTDGVIIEFSGTDVDSSIDKYGMKSETFRFAKVSSDPIYINQEALLWFVNESGILKLKAKAKDGLLETEFNITGVGVVSEAPQETPNGVITLFTTIDDTPYTPNSISVFVQGVAQVPGVDFNETNPLSGTFTMTTAPVTGVSMLVTYATNSAVDFGTTASDHGALDGLGDDDHGQYHNDTRGDVRYYTKTLTDTWRNSVTQAEMGFLDGVTSDVQTQITANTTPTEVEAIITAEIVDGQSIDNAIDALISTHVGLSDPHTGYFLLAGETTSAKIYSGADLIFYSDAGSTEKARIDGATGNITTEGRLTHQTAPWQIESSSLRDSLSMFGVLAATSHTDMLLAATVESLEGFTGSWVDISGSKTAEHYFTEDMTETVDLDSTYSRIRVVVSGMAWRSAGGLYIGRGYDATNKAAGFTITIESSDTGAFSGEETLRLSGVHVDTGNEMVFVPVYLGFADGYWRITFSHGDDETISSGVHVFNSIKAIAVRSHSSSAWAYSKKLHVDYNNGSYRNYLNVRAVFNANVDFSAGIDVTGDVTVTGDVDGVDVSTLPALITANTTPTEVEAIITAELVNGQSIDNAIDSLISTHAAISDAHHAKYTDAEVDTIVATHTAIDDAHHTRYADSEVESVITAELVNGQSIDLAIDALILTHKNIAGAHHTRYADSEVESVITAELVNGQSIDLAIDALILTHKNIAGAHHTRYADSEVESVITAELVNGQSIDNAIDTLISTHAGLSDPHTGYLLADGTRQLDGDLTFTGTQSIKTTAGALTLASATTVDIIKATQAWTRHAVTGDNTYGRIGKALAGDRFDMWFNMDYVGAAFTADQVDEGTSMITLWDDAGVGKISMYAQDAQANPVSLALSLEISDGHTLVRSASTDSAWLELKSIAKAQWLSPAYIDFVGLDSADNETTYSRMYSLIGSNVAGSELGRLGWDLTDGGTLYTAMSLRGGGSGASYLTIASERNADAQEVGVFTFYGKNDNATPEVITYAGFAAKIIDASDGTEDGELLINLTSGGGYATSAIFRGAALEFQQATEISVTTGDLTFNTSSGDVLVLSDCPDLNRYMPTGTHSTPQSSAVLTTRKGLGTMADGVGPKMAFRTEDNTATEHWTGGLSYSHDFTNERSAYILQIKSGAGDTWATTEALRADYQHIRLAFPLLIKETTAAITDVAAYGQVWVKTATPNQLWFTDDTGIEYRLSGTDSKNVTMGDGVNVIATGDKMYFRLSEATRLVRYSLMADASGSLVVVLKKIAWASYPGSWSTVATMTLSSASKVEATTGWNLDADYVYKLEVTGTPSTIKLCGVEMVFRGA